MRQIAKKSFPTIISALADTGSSDGLLSGLLPGGGGLLGGLGSGGLLGGLLPGNSDDSSRYLVEHLEFSYPVNQVYCQYINFYPTAAAAAPTSRPATSTATVTVAACSAASSPLEAS